MVWYPWAAIILFSAISVSGNALHAIDATDLQVPVAVAATVSTVPAIALLVASHLLAMMLSEKSSRLKNSHVRPRNSRAHHDIVRVETSPPAPLRAINIGDRELLAEIRTMVARNENVTGASVARLANVSERTGRRRLENLRRLHPGLLESQARSLDAR
jgi:hypothetical protein